MNKLKRAVAIYLFFSLSAGCLGCGLFALWGYYFFYLRWAGRFNGEGRYFDPVEGVVYSADSSGDLLVSVLAFLLALVLWLMGRALRKKISPTGARLGSDNGEGPIAMKWKALLRWFAGGGRDADRWVDEHFLRIACKAMLPDLDWDSLDSGRLHRATSIAKTHGGTRLIVGVLGKADSLSELLDDAAQDRLEEGLPMDTPLWLYVPASLALPALPESVVVKRL